MGIQIFKIRRSDGLFSTGGAQRRYADERGVHLGYGPDFEERGKEWRRTGDVKSHLALIGPEIAAIAYCDCVVVEYALAPVGAHPDFIAEYIPEREAYLERQQAMWKAWDDEREREKYEQLKARFESQPTAPDVQAHKDHFIIGPPLASWGIMEEGDD